MSKKLLYLTLPVILTAIKDVLATYPSSFYHNFFLTPELQQKLISYIIKQVRKYYILFIDDAQISSLNCHKVSLSFQQWLHIKDITRKGIDHFLQENCVWDSSYMYQQMRDRVNAETELTKKNDDEIDALENRTMALIKLDEYYPNYREEVFNSYDITKFEVVAKGNEKVGFVENILIDEDSGRILYFIVDTGLWIFGKKVLLPIGLGLIVYMDRRVYVENLTKEQVKNLPEYKENMMIDPDYEERVRAVYRPLVERAIANQNYNSPTYDYQQEPYFYEIKDENLKRSQERLISKRSR